MNPDAYLRRIAYRGPREPTLETLTALHRAHLYAVPFENLDIALGRPLELALPALFAKVVEGRRGGFCYELNGLFAWLLGELGFAVEMLEGQVYGEGGGLGPAFDHMLLRVDLGEPWVADVGFGDSFVESVALDPGREQEQHGSAYRFVEIEDDLQLERRRAGGDEWQPQYRFTLAPRRLDDYREMFRYHQSSPGSPFTRKALASLATPEGRMTFSNGRLIVTAGGGRDERQVASAEEVRSLLGERFGIELPLDAPIERLLGRQGT